MEKTTCCCCFPIYKKRETKPTHLCATCSEALGTERKFPMGFTQEEMGEGVDGVSCEGPSASGGPCGDNGGPSGPGGEGEGGGCGGR